MVCNLTIEILLRRPPFHTRVSGTETGPWLMTPASTDVEEIYDNSSN